LKVTTTAPPLPHQRHVGGPYAKSAQRQQEIVEAATNVFASRGYHGGSLRDIARQIGLSLTSVIHHFPSKSDLLEAVLHNADQTGEWMFGLARAEGVKAGILALVDSNLERQELLRLLAIVWSEASDPEHPAHQWFVDRQTNFVSLLAKLLEHDVEQRRVSADLDPELTGRLLVAMWDGLQLQWLLDPTQDMPAKMDTALDRLLN
jgi:AcrR family transcriptional regulator